MSSETLTGQINEKFTNAGRELEQNGATGIILGEKDLSGVILSAANRTLSAEGGGIKGSLFRAVVNTSSSEEKGKISVNASGKGEYKGLSADIDMSLAILVKEGALKLEEYGVSSKNFLASQALKKAGSKLPKANDPGLNAKINGFIETEILSRMGIDPKEGEEMQFSYKVEENSHNLSININNPNFSSVTTDEPTGREGAEIAATKSGAIEDSYIETPIVDTERQNQIVEKINPLEYFQRTKTQERRLLRSELDPPPFVVAYDVDAFLDDPNLDPDFSPVIMMWNRLGGVEYARRVVEAAAPQISSAVEDGVLESKMEEIVQNVKNVLGEKDVNTLDIEDYIRITGILVSAKKDDPECEGVVRASKMLLLEGLKK